MPPASTTPAFFSTGFMSVVWASAVRPSSTARDRITSKSRSSSAAASAMRFAHRRETVRTVPSAGFITALYAADTPSCIAAANWAASAVSCPFRLLDTPRNSRERITPEFPRAPRRRAEAVVLAAWATVSGSDAFSSVTAAAMVMDIFVPVSPSGTGNTFRSLMACFWAVMAAAPWRIIRLNSAPVICSVMSGPPYSVMESTQTSTARTSTPVFFATT